MSEEKRDERAAEEEEARLELEAMTDGQLLEAMTSEKLYLTDRISELYDNVEKIVIEDDPDFHTHWQIACIMRSAAGLPYSDTPASGWREEGTPEISMSVLGIIYAAGGWAIERPKEVSDEL